MLKDMIYKLRTDAGLSQEQFAMLFDVSRQSVQKWEAGTAVPEMDKIIRISKHFDISLDALVLGNGTRIVEEMRYTKKIRPQYANMHDWEFYASFLSTEYRQSVEEGLDIEAYQNVFSAVARLPKNEVKKRLGDVLFDVVVNAKKKDGYSYVEPSDLEEIKALRKEYHYKKQSQADLEKKIHGAWMGRICGCMLGKSVEGISVKELTSLLKETGNFPMQRYIRRSEISEEICKKYHYGLSGRPYADEIDGMPVDDDTNYTVVAQIMIEKYGRDFTPYDVSQTWLDYQSKNAYCTAERVAFCNFVKGYAPPQSAVYKNPYREWIGAQIRGDYFGYINPGNPELAAEMAWRDASVSHIKNGIYGEMLISAMLAVAAETNRIEDIILGGLAEIPHTSRLYEAILEIIRDYRSGVAADSFFEKFYQRFDDSDQHDWCHTISNAMIVVAALLYGGGDYGRSICMAVQSGFDTDCNGATVGSILGMANGIDSIPDAWIVPIHNTLHTSIFGVGTVKISDCVKKTMEHIK